MSGESNLLCKPAVDPGFLAPRRQFLQFLIRHANMRTLFQEERQVSFHIQAMCLSHFHHRVDCSAGLGSAGSITEQPVLSSNREGTDAILAGLSEYSDNRAYPNKILIRIILAKALKLGHCRKKCAHNSPVSPTMLPSLKEVALWVVR